MLRSKLCISLCLLTFVIMSCERGGYFLDCQMGLFFKVQNADGDCILNNYNADSIKIYRIMPDSCLVLVDTIDNKYDNGNRGFEIRHLSEPPENINDPIYMQLWLANHSPHIHGPVRVSGSTELDVQSCTTYIQWNSQDVDTVYATFTHNKNKHYYDKVYYNGELIVSSWEDHYEKMSQGIYPIIIK